RANKTDGQKFSTEEFVEAVIKDVRGMHKLDDGNIFTLSWSSSGPAAYAASLSKNAAVKGSFVAMSVFVPARLPQLDAARGHAYYLYHSPDDTTCNYSFAEQAKKSLAAAGARVQLVTYSGGHGWHGDVFGDIRRGVAWLEKNAGKAAFANGGAGQSA